MKTVGILALLVLSAGGVMGMAEQDSPAADEVRATRFVLVGADGQELGVWSVGEGGDPSFRLKGSEGEKIRLECYQGSVEFSLQQAGTTYGGVQMRASQDRSAVNVIGVSEHGRERSNVAIRAGESAASFSVRDTKSGGAILESRKLRFEGGDSGTGAEFGPGK